MEPVHTGTALPDDLLSPVILLERIVWASKEGRQFLLSDGYVGPDRRFTDVGPPPGVPGRRREDAMRTGPADEGGAEDATRNTAP